MRVGQYPLCFYVVECMPSVRRDFRIQPDSGAIDRENLLNVEERTITILGSWSGSTGVQGHVFYWLLRELQFKIQLNLKRPSKISASLVAYERLLC